LRPENFVECSRESVEKILRWDFDRVIVTHGDVLDAGGPQQRARCLLLFVVARRTGWRRCDGLHAAFSVTPIQCSNGFQEPFAEVTPFAVGPLHLRHPQLSLMDCLPYVFIYRL